MRRLVCRWRGHRLVSLWKPELGSMALECVSCRRCGWLGYR